MRVVSFASIVLWAVLWTACGGGQGGPPFVGDDCDTDDDCPTRLCWDFNDYDSLCGGKVCSRACTSDQDCIDSAQISGAPQPDRAACLDDGTCDLVGTGLGSFVCALQ